MVESAAEFRKNSFSDEDSATLAKVSALYQNVADDAVSAGDSASFIISQIKAFNIEADNAIDIVNAVNAVSNNFAVSSSDISSALTKTSSAMGVLGNDFQHTIGLVTAGTEIMTGQAGKVARGLRTIGNRFADAAQQADSIEYSVGGVTKSLSLLDETTGDIKSTFDIFQGLKSDWDAMTNSEKQALAITYAGQTQFEVFAAVMNNFQTAVDATSTAFDSAGSAMQENEKYMDSVAAKENQLKAEFEDFSNRVLSKELVTGFLNAGQAALSFANNDVGAAIVRIAGLSAGAFALVGILGQVAKAIKGVMSAATSIGSLTTTIGQIAAVIGLVVAAVTAVVEIVRAINNAIEANKYENLIAQYHELNQEVVELSENLATAKQRLEELNSVSIADRTSEWETETEALREQIEAYEFLLELKKQAAAEKLAAAMQADVITGVKVSQVADAIYSKVNPETGLGQISDVIGSGYLIDYRDAEYMAAHPELDGNKAAFTTQQIVALTKEYENQKEAVQALSVAFGELYSESDLEAINAAIVAGDTEEALRLRAEKLKLIGITFEETSQTADEYMTQQAEVARDLSQAIDKATESNYNLTAAQKEEIDEYVSANKERYQYVKSLDNQTEAQSTFAKAYESFAHDVARYNVDSGLMSVGEAAIYLGNTLGLAEDDVNALQIAIYNIDSSSMYKLMNDAIKAGNGLDLVRRYAELLGGTGLDVSGILAGLNNIANTAAGAYSALYQLKVLAAGGSGSLFLEEWELDENGLYVKKKNPWDLPTIDIPTGGPSGSGGGGTKTDKELERLKNIVSLRESELDLMEKQDKPYDERIRKMKEIQDALHDQAQHIRKTTNNLEDINKLSSKWWSIQKNINNLLKEAAEAAKDALQKQADDIESAFAYAIKMAQKEMDAINEKYDKQLDDIEKANDALQKQITLEEKLKAIAEAKSKKLYVYKDGRFQYVDDIDAINEAQSDYEEFLREKNIESQKEQIEADRKAELAIWEQWVTNWQNVTDSYKDAQDRLLAEQVLGISFEASNWAQRLGNAEDFKIKYAAIMAEIAQLQSKIDSGGVSYDPNVDYSALMEKATSKEEFEYLAAMRDAKAKDMGVDYTKAGYRTNEQLRREKGYARGTLNASGGLSLVGEEGPELRVLQKGDAIFPADMTKNLWEWGKIPPSALKLSKIWGGGETSQQYVFNIDNLSLPDVTDAPSLLSGLKRMAYQRAFGRA